MTHGLRLAVVPAYLLLCLLLGGASAAGFWANMVLQLLAIPLLLWALLARRSTPVPSGGRQLLLVFALLLLVPLVQLVPLPSSIWTGLAGRETIAAGFRQLGEPLPWMPISLTPDRTVASLLWLLPAAAVLLGIVRLGGFKPAWIAWVLATVTCVSVALGAVQVAGDSGSGWYLYEITNIGATVGFFSNANHLATLLVVTVPFLTALYLHARSKGYSAKSASGMFVILAGALGVVLVGIVINSSLAGIGLMVPVAAASILLLRSRAGRLPLWTVLLIAALAIGSVAAVFSTPFDNNLTGEAAERSTNSRSVSFATSLAAARDFLPLGSGVGTFVDIYPSYEDPALVTRWYMNHVHSDYIELLLETGLPGALVLLIFLLWWARRTWAIWSAEQPDYFARAATIGSAAILAHSCVDYPLRTAAISAVFAACCALMTETRARVQAKSAEGPERHGEARHLSAD